MLISPELAEAINEKLPWEDRLVTLERLKRHIENGDIIRSFTWDMQAFKICQGYQRELNNLILDALFHVNRNEPIIHPLIFRDLTFSLNALAVKCNCPSWCLA